MSDIAAMLGWHPSTIHREISRKRHLDEHPAFRGYFHVAAHDKAGCRRLRGGKIVRDATLTRYVEERLSDYWSPEQIAGYLHTQTDNGLSVCHETIYQFVYGPQGRARQLGRLLPSQRRVRRRRQTIRLEQAGAIRVFTDVMSGKSMERPGLAELLAYARKGDVLAIAHFERRLISERTKDGIAAARIKGKMPGRQPLDQTKEPLNKPVF